MKTILTVSLMALWLMTGVGVAQPVASPPLSARTPRPLDARNFDLNFGGGTPKQLVEAIQDATGEPLNAIIPEEDKDVRLPAVKVRQVTVEELFQAMEQSSRRTEAIVTGYYLPSTIAGESRAQYSQFEASTGFRKVGGVWVFLNKKPVVPPDVVQSRTKFYHLTPYLGQSTVEDITTAIKTAWSMMTKNNLGANRSGVGTELKFHKETGLLIAVGDPKEVQVIDDVLAALRPDLAPKPKAGASPGKTNEPPKH